MAQETPPPVEGNASRAETSRKCPYCQVSFEAGEATISCGACSTLHHAECWKDNRGCTVMGCDGGPNSGRAPHRTEPGQPAEERLPPLARPTTSSAGPKDRSKADTAPLASGPMPQDRTPRDRRPLLAFSVLAILAVGLAAAIGLVYGGVFSSEETNAPDNPTVAGEVESGNGQETAQSDRSSSGGDRESVSPETGFPQVSKEKQRLDIEALIREWHSAAFAGDTETIWNLLSSRKQDQINRGKFGALNSEGTFDADYKDREGWEEDQTFQSPTSTQNVRIRFIEPSYPEEGVRSIEVTGLVEGGCPFEGVTWVKFEGGSWRYEPGYLVNPKRKKDWKARESKTLRSRPC